MTKTEVTLLSLLIMEKRPDTFRQIATIMNMNEQHLHRVKAKLKLKGHFWEPFPQGRPKK